MPTPPARPVSARDCLSARLATRSAPDERAGYSVLLNQAETDVEREVINTALNLKYSRSAVYDEKRCRAIDPRRSGWFEVWDTIMLSALMEVAIFTPYELAFVNPDFNLWFVKNRCCDLVFCADMVIRFLTAVPDAKVNGRLVTDLSQVARIYLSQWFIIDLLSTFPWDAYYLWAVRYAGKTDSLPEVLRLLRIFRLVRLTNGKSILRRFNIYFGFQWKAVTMAQNFMFLMLVCHWSACFWGGCGLREPKDDEQTWLQVVQNTKGGPASLYNSPVNVYLISLYWAVMTITGIGYGDITPQNSSEYVAAVFLMTSMAAGWAYIIGEITASMSNLNPHEVGFKQSVDALNSLLLDWNVPHTMRKSLRTYFHEAKDLWRYLEQKRTLDQLSPHMQGQVSMRLHSAWIENVRWLRGLQEEVTSLMPVLQNLRAMMYGPGELISAQRCLYIMWRGLCIRKGRIYGRNEIWGEDMILHNELLRIPAEARAVGYVELFMLVYEDLVEIAEKVPAIKKSVRKQHKYIALLRAIVLIKRIVKELHFRNVVNRFKLTREQRCQLSDEILSGNLTEEVVTDGEALQRAFSKDVRFEGDELIPSRETTSDSERQSEREAHTSGLKAPPPTRAGTNATEQLDKTLAGAPVAPVRSLSSATLCSQAIGNGILMGHSTPTIQSHSAHSITSNSHSSLGTRRDISPGLRNLAVDLVEEFLTRAQTQNLEDQPRTNTILNRPGSFGQQRTWDAVMTPATMVRNAALRGLNLRALDRATQVAHNFTPSFGWR